MTHHILFLDDDIGFLNSQKILLKDKYQVSVADNITEAVAVMKTEPVDLVFLDIGFGQNREGIDYIHKIKKQDPSVVVIMLSGHKDPDMVVEAIKNGADDYLCKPYPAGELTNVINKNLNKKNDKDKNDALFEYCNEEQTRVVTASESMQEVLKKAKLLKGHDANILIEGESGTGKEVLARFIHANEENPKRPFIAVNCAAIPEQLLESELFGHERGAFTGAIKRKIGKFELAHHGDIFLDEINSLRPEFQAKILRVLQEKEFYHVGGTIPIRVKVRVIVASNKDLASEVIAGNFRQDLFYRLRVISLRIPPLRERVGDIKLLLDYFVKKHSQTNKQIKFTDAAMKLLREYNWPGNIRELENLVQSLLIVSGGGFIDVHHLPVWIVKPNNPVVPQELFDTASYAQLNKALHYYVERYEKSIIKRVVNENKGNTSDAARILKISRSTLYNKLGKGGEYDA